MDVSTSTWQPEDEPHNVSKPLWAEQVLIHLAMTHTVNIVHEHLELTGNPIQITFKAYTCESHHLKIAGYGGHPCEHLNGIDIGEVFDQRVNQHHHLQEDYWNAQSKEENGRV